MAWVPPSTAKDRLVSTMDTLCTFRMVSFEQRPLRVRKLIRLNVLHVIPSVSERSGGPAQAIFPMCRALVAPGLEITIATTNDGLTDLSNHSIRSSVDDGTLTYFFPVELGNRFKYSRPLRSWLNENVCGFNVVHIHAVFNHSSVAAARACRKHNVPYVIR